jgi:cation transporter-like permease
MMELLIAFLFFAKIIMALIISFFGILGSRRGKNYIGDVSDRVKFDPKLRKKANNSLALGGACAFALCLPPLAWSFSAATSGDPFPMIGLAIIVAYSIVTTSALLYPFERIKRIGTAVNSP